MALIAAIVDWAELGRTGVASAVAGVGAALLFSLAVLGAANWIELRRASRELAALASAALTVLALAGFAAAIVVGLVLMADK
jgi:hypothetical protein